MIDKINLIIGFDQRESVAYHVFSQSVIENTSTPVSIMPLAKNLLHNYCLK